MSFGQSWQYDVAHTFLAQKIVDKLVHMNNGIAACSSLPELTSIIQQWLQGGVYVRRFAHEPQVERA